MYPLPLRSNRRHHGTGFELYRHRVRVKACTLHNATKLCFKTSLDHLRMSLRVRVANSPRRARIDSLARHLEPFNFLAL